MQPTFGGASVCATAERILTVSGEMLRTSSGRSTEILWLSPSLALRLKSMEHGTSTWEIILQSWMICIDYHVGQSLFICCHSGVNIWVHSQSLPIIWYCCHSAYMKLPSKYCKMYTDYYICLLSSSKLSMYLCL